MNGRAPSLLVLGLGVVGCSVLRGSGGEDVAQRPVVIPLSGDAGAAGAERNVDAYYRSVFDLLKAAYRDRDAKTLRHLLAQHQRSDLPDHISGPLDQFEVLADGVEFELALAKRGQILVVDPVRPLNEPQRLRLVLTGESEGQEVELGGSPGQLPCSFLCTLKVTDLGVLGERQEHRTSKLLAVERLHTLSADAPLAVEFEVPGSSGEVAIREAHLSAELLPCKVRIGGRLTPIRRTTCGTLVSTTYPANVGPIQRAPLETLGEALRRGSRKYFRHVVLAAHFMPAEHNEQAIALLVRKLRVGTQDQARVAMLGLEILTGQDLGVTSRQLWLRWWERRARENSPGDKIRKEADRQ